MVRVVMADKDMVEEMCSVSSWRARTGWRRCGPRRHGGQGKGGGDVVRVVMADKDMVEEMWFVSSWRARTWWRRCGTCRHGGQ